MVPRGTRGGLNWSCIRPRDAKYFIPRVILLLYYLFPCSLRMSLCLKFIIVAFFCRMWFVSVNIYHFVFRVISYDAMRLTGRLQHLALVPLQYVQIYIFIYCLFAQYIRLLTITIHNTIVSISHVSSQEAHTCLSDGNTAFRHVE